MDRCDYMAIARIIKDNYIVSNEPVKLVLRDMVDQMCQYFNMVDSKFSRKDFVADSVIGE